MAEASKPSFLGSFAPWARSATPPPKSPSYPPKEDPLKQSTGHDHTFTLRPSPSLRKYPKDCPPIVTKWFYAIDVAKRKPFAPDGSLDDKEKAKPQPIPKKLVPFSTSDSQAIENAFRSLDTAGTIATDENVARGKASFTKVPVNEDYLFDVNIEKRELEPAYWLGPVYEVRRGSWFYAEGSSLRACDENLANQLEEGYLKAAPWKRVTTAMVRSASQPRTRPSSTFMESQTTESSNHLTPTSADPNANDRYVHRLFGAHMNTTVTYQDATTAILSSDDFMSRMSSTVYGRFGSYGGTKVVRGWTESSTSKDTKATTSNADATSGKDRKKHARIASNTGIPDPDQIDKADEPADKSDPEIKSSPRLSALERQMSSLAGLAKGQVSDVLAEENAREQEEQDLEDLREHDGDDQNRTVDHLVLVTHGIGQRLGLRLESINFIHDVNMLRKTMKAVYGSAPDLQALSGEKANCRIQVLPVCWRHLLDFPKQSLRQNRKEFDLGDIDPMFDDEYPSLQDITVEGVPAVRNLITDLAMDILLYQSAYREHIASIVQQEANRIYHLFKKRTDFQGKVSLVGHSLGSAVLFDILCRQDAAPLRPPKRRVSVRNVQKEAPDGAKDLKLDFDVENFFALGSPIALFQMLKGRTIAGRKHVKDSPIALSPFDSDPLINDPYHPFGGRSGKGAAPNLSKDLIPITVSSPKCAEFYNIFHPTDPIAYRVEPLISRAMAQLKSQPLPYTKKGLFDVPGIANISARVGQQVMSSWYNLTSGVASTLINRSLGITGDEQALPQDKGKPSAVVTPASSTLLPNSTPIVTTSNAGSTAGSTPQPGVMATEQKQKDLAVQAAKSSRGTGQAPMPTLIDSEIETLYTGFQKQQQKKSQSTTTSPELDTTVGGNNTSPSNLGLSGSPDPSKIHTNPSIANLLSAEVDPSQINSPTPSTAEFEIEQDRLRKLRREEAKVKALNSNGRVDYHIQEGMFDVSLLASIASHLSYWADEDVNHFMIGQMLKSRGSSGLGNGKEVKKGENEGLNIVDGVDDGGDQKTGNWDWSDGGWGGGTGTGTGIGPKGNDDGRDSGDIGRRQ